MKETVIVMTRTAKGTYVDHQIFESDFEGEAYHEAAQYAGERKEQFPHLTVQIFNELVTVEPIER